jgi:L-amino acid N-acyltransferase YncA
MSIREATGVDLAAIDDIYNHYVQTSTSTFQETPTTPEERRAWFAAHGPDHPVLVFEDDELARASGAPRVSRIAGGAIAGWASLNRYHPREAYGRTVELSVYVRHGLHRRGVGRALVVELLERARASGHHVVLAQVAADQDASLALHRGLGFREVGRLREVGFKFGRWLDVLMLDLQLPAAADRANTRPATPHRELT